MNKSDNVIIYNISKSFKNIYIALRYSSSSSSSSFILSSYHIVNSVCCNHALVSGPTSKMVVYVGGQLLIKSVLECPTHMLHCLSVPTYLLMICSGRSQLVVCLESSPWTSSPGSDTWLCTRWVRMLPIPASRLPQSEHI